MSPQHHTTTLLFIVVTALIVFIYIQYYSKYNSSYEIVQTYLDKINIDLLYERNPIVIYDSIKTPKQLLGTLFKYSYVSKSEYQLEHKLPVMNRAKFSFVYSTTDQDTYVNLINPSYKSSMVWKPHTKSTDKVSLTNLEDTTVEYVTIKLKPYQVLILPTHWIIQTNAPLTKVNLHDFISYIYFKLS
jgi:hypothetical protein